MNTSKNTIKKELTVLMGETYDESIVIDALFEKEAYLFSAYQLRHFEDACRKYDIDRKAVKIDIDMWEVRA